MESVYAPLIKWLFSFTLTKRLHAILWSTGRFCFFCFVMFFLFLFLFFFSVIKCGIINALFDFSARTAVSYIFATLPPTLRAFGLVTLINPIISPKSLCADIRKFFFPLGVYVKNLSEYFVKSPEEIVRLLKSGKKRLAVAETKMNRQSSRLV